MIKVKAAILLFLLIITFILSVPPFLLAWIILLPTKLLLDIQLSWYDKLKKDLK